MPSHTLDETLLALLGAVSVPEAAGLVVTNVDLDVPLEASIAVEDGALVVRASVPHSRWVSGFLPRVHLAHLRMELIEDG
jgi:hypothetical protein